jgi:hypothetical protein
MKKISLVIILIFAFPVWVRAADIRAVVDRTHAAMGESVNLSVTVSGGDAEVDVSAIRDFKVIPRGTSTSVSIVNGSMSRQASYNYVLIPLREGRLVIPPLTVVSAGKSLQTRAIVVQVSRQPLAEDASSDLFVRAQISEENPFEGRQIIYTFRLYATVQLANAKFQKPDFSGFTSKKVGDTKSFRKVINGREYNVSELSYVLVPLKSGMVTIDPGKLGCDVVQRKQRNRRSLFDSFFGQAELEPKILATEAISINVRPLPAYNGDVKFSGLVGEFRIQAGLENTEIQVGESTTLAITVEGSGNIMDALPPEVIVPDAFKVYADNPEEHINVDGSGFSGKKVFRTALVAVKPGIYTIVPVQISYFDVSKSAYQTLSTRPYTLTAYPAAEKEKIEIFSAPAVQEQPRLKKKKVEFTGRDILPLKEDLDVLESHTSMNLSRFIIMLAAPFLLYLAGLAALKFSQKRDDPAGIMAQRAENALKKARKIEVSREEFLANLYRALVAAILANAGTKGESLTYAEAEEILCRSGHSDATGTQAAELLKKIESARYGGLSLDAAFKSDLLQETNQLVRSLLR